MTEQPRTRKRWGQNYLQDPGVLDRIRRSLDLKPEDRLIEIGPGTGALTRHLLTGCAALHAMEIDPRMAVYLDPLKLEHPGFSWELGDFLDWRPPANDRDLRLVGNIPYYITSPIVLLAFELRSQLRDAHLLMQKEVARRLVAEPGSRDYGILSVYARLFAKPRLLFTVSRQVFVPRPRVDSALIRLDFQSTQMYPAVFEAWLRKVIRTAFNQRRKTLRNSLKELLPADAETTLTIDLDLRAEQLAPVDFETLARQMEG